ncbi:MAG: FAD-dependent oxidoreductase, partial [Mycobacterium sp.]
LLGTALEEEPSVPPGVASPIIAKTTTGETLQADIWFRCYGVNPTSDYLVGDLAAARRSDGFVEVDDRLRVTGFDNVFAIGDVTAVAEPKMAGAAGRHAKVVEANILALSSGERPEAIYTPGPPGVLVPIGMSGGASQVPGPDGPSVLGAGPTAQYKGEHLMIERFADLFDVTNIEPDGEDQPRSPRH